MQIKMGGSSPGQLRPAERKFDSCNKTAAVATAGASLQVHNSVAVVARHCTSLHQADAGISVQQAALEDIPRNTTLFVSFSNAHYGEFLINWAAHLKLLGVTALPRCVDPMVSAPLHKCTADIPL